MRSSQERRGSHRSSITLPDLKLPRGCVAEWSVQANKDGFLDWEGFSSGIAKALKADADRLKKMADMHALPTSGTEKMMKSLQGRKGRGLGARLLARPVKAREIEAFLCQCEERALVQALTHTKKEMYRCQVILQKLNSKKEEEEEEEEKRKKGENITTATSSGLCHCVDQQ